MRAKRYLGLLLVAGCGPTTPVTSSVPSSSPTSIAAPTASATTAPSSVVAQSSRVDPVLWTEVTRTEGGIQVAPRSLPASGLPSILADVKACAFRESYAKGAPGGIVRRLRLTIVCAEVPPLVDRIRRVGGSDWRVTDDPDDDGSSRLRASNGQETVTLWPDNCEVEVAHPSALPALATWRKGTARGAAVLARVTDQIDLAPDGYVLKCFYDGKCEWELAARGHLNGQDALLRELGFRPFTRASWIWRMNPAGDTTTATDHGDGTVALHGDTSWDEAVDSPVCDTQMGQGGW